MKGNIAWKDSHTKLDYTASHHSFSFFNLILGEKVRTGKRITKGKGKRKEKLSSFLSR